MPDGEDGNQENKPARRSPNGKGDKRRLFRMQVKIKGLQDQNKQVVSMGCERLKKMGEHPSRQRIGIQ